MEAKNTMKEKKSRHNRKVVFERYAPEANLVQIAGTFNNWDLTKNLLKKEKDGTWKVSIEISPGRYEYRFLVDGNWKNDQLPEECVPNAFGSLNCVMEVF